MITFMNNVFSFLTPNSLAEELPRKNVEGNESFDTNASSAPKMDEIFHHEAGFGGKTITFLGSCVLNFNNVTGPAVVVLPLLFQQAGWLLPTLALVLMWLMSSFSACMLCESIQRIPGNHAFQRRYEYCTLVRHYFGDTWYCISQVGYNVGLTASNIAAMVICIQVMDSIVNWIFGKSYGISYEYSDFRFVSTLPATDGVAYCEWGTNGSGDCLKSVISIGFFLTMLVCVPFGMLNLDDNMWFQYLSTLGQVLFSLEFIVQFVYNLIPGSASYCQGNGPSRTPIIGSNMSQVIGICVFAYSYVSTIPSWVNEKKLSVSVNKSVWLPSLFGLMFNIFLGILGSMAFNLTDISGNALSGADDILNILDGNASAEATCSGYQEFGFTHLSVYLFGFFGYIPGVPILAIMVRYNLQNGKILGPRSSYFIAVILPWIIAGIFYQKEMLTTFCNWFAIIFQGFINLVIPPLLYRASLIAYPDVIDLSGQRISSPFFSRVVEKDDLKYLNTCDSQQTEVCNVVLGNEEPWPSSRSELQTRKSAEEENLAEEETPDVLTRLEDIMALLKRLLRHLALRNLRFRLFPRTFHSFSSSNLRVPLLSDLPSEPNHNGVLLNQAITAVDITPSPIPEHDFPVSPNIEVYNQNEMDFSAFNASADHKSPKTVNHALSTNRLFFSSDNLQVSKGRALLHNDGDDDLAFDELRIDAVPRWLNCDRVVFSTLMAYFLLILVLFGIIITVLQAL